MRAKYIFIDLIKNFFTIKPSLVKNYVLRIKKFNLKNKSEKIFISSIIKKYKSKKVLDYGCGDCYLNLFLNKKSIKYIGVDNDSKLKNSKIYSKNFYSSRNFNYKKHKSFFDCIVLSHVIGHVYLPDTTLQRLKKLLIHEGILIIVTPNKYYKILYFFLNLFNDYLPDLTISTYYSSLTLKKLLIKNSFKIVENYNYSIVKNKIKNEFINSRVLVIGEK